MPITMANIGEQRCICRISGRDEVRRHLNNLGFIEGETVTVVSKVGGNLIINVKDSRVALDKSMANRIFI